MSHIISPSPASPVLECKYPGPLFPALVMKYFMSCFSKFLEFLTYAYASLKTMCKVNSKSLQISVYFSNKK